MTVVDAWHRTDAALYDADAFEEHALTLPVRLEHIARAIRDLDNGDPDAVRSRIETLEEADEHDAAAVLRALLDPDAEVPDEAAAMTLLPLADLIQLMVANVTADDDVPRPTDPSAELQACAQRRAVLNPMLQMLANAFDRIARDPRLSKLIPRAEQIRVAGQMLALHGSVNNATIQQAFPELLVDFSPERWPDLTVDASLVASWAQGDDDVWTRQHTHALRAATRLPEGPRRALLGAMVARIERDATGGRLRELAAPAWAASELAATIDGLDDLAAQLHALRLRLQWIEEKAPPGELLQSLWVHGELTQADRLEVARQLLVHPPEEPDPQVVVQSQLFLLAHLPDPSEAAGVLEAGARGAPREMLEQGLAQVGASEARTTFILALHTAHAGHIGQALESVPVLVSEHGEAAAAEGVVETALERMRRSDLTAEGGLGERLDAAARALGEADALTIHLVPLILSGLRAVGAEIPDALADAVRRTLESVRDTPRYLAAQMVGYTLIGDDDAARTLMRDVGRSLRKRTPEAADDHAMRVLSWVMFWGDAEQRETLQKLVHPLTRFLLREGPARPAASAARVADDGVSLVRGAVQWFLWEREALADDRRWIDLCCRLVRVPDALASYGVQLVRSALDENPQTIEAMDARIRAELSELVQSGTHPDTWFAATHDDDSSDDSSDDSTSGTADTEAS